MTSCRDWWDRVSTLSQESASSILLLLLLEHRQEALRRPSALKRPIFDRCVFRLRFRTMGKKHRLHTPAIPAWSPYVLSIASRSCRPDAGWRCAVLSSCWRSFYAPPPRSSLLPDPRFLSDLSGSSTRCIRLWRKVFELRRQGRTVTGRTSPRRWSRQRNSRMASFLFLSLGSWWTAPLAMLRRARADVGQTPNSSTSGAGRVV